MTAGNPVALVERRTSSRWTGALDVASAVVLGASVSVAAFGGIRLSLGPVYISATSVWKLLGVLAILVACRQLIVPAPPLAVTLRKWTSAAAVWYHSASTRAVIPVWMATRLGVIAGFIGVSVIGMHAAHVGHACERRSIRHANGAPVVDFSIRRLLQRGVYRVSFPSWRRRRPSTQWKRSGRGRLVHGACSWACRGQMVFCSRCPSS